MTSGKVITLLDVQNIPDIRKNLIIGSLLIHSGHKIVLESNCLIISKGNLFVGKGFVSDGLFRLNICEPSDLSLYKNFNYSSFSYVVLNVESCEIRHRRLSYINFGIIIRLMNLDSIPKSKIDLGSKYQICVQAKLPKKHFQHINQNSNLLDLIHTTICDS